MSAICLHACVLVAKKCTVVPEVCSTAIARLKLRRLSNWPGKSKSSWRMATLNLREEVNEIWIFLGVPVVLYIDIDVYICIIIYIYMYKYIFIYIHIHTASLVFQVFLTSFCNSIRCFLSNLANLSGCSRWQKLQALPELTVAAMYCTIPMQYPCPIVRLYINGCFWFP